MKKRLLVAILLACVKAGASVPVTQEWWELKPEEYTYTREDDRMGWLDRTIGCPEKAIVVQTDMEECERPRFVHYFVYIQDPSWPKWWIFQKGLIYEDFVKYYNLDE